MAKTVFHKTNQRESIRKALLDADRPLSPQELLEAAQASSPSVGQATVYRTIKAFLAQGWIESISLPGEPPRYELAGKHHHHHFRCRTCDGVFEIAGCELTLGKRLPPGFKLENHEIVLYGLCDKCSRASGSSRRGKVARRSR